MEYDPSRIKFGRAQNIQEVISRINNYLIDTDFQPRSNIIMPVLNINFKHWTTQVHVFVYDKNLYIVLYDRDSPNACMSLTLRNITDGVEGKIQMISSQYNCNIPETRRGTWLMELADNLLHSLGCTRAILHDESQMRCNDHMSVSLLFLRIFQGKFSII